MFLSTTLVLPLIVTATQELSISRMQHTPLEITQFNGVGVTIDRSSMDSFSIGDIVVIPEFPLDLDHDVTLRLQRFDVFAPDAEVIIASIGKRGELIQRIVPLPELMLLKGTIEGDPSSKVFLAIGAHTTNGLIERDGRTYVLAKDRTSGLIAVYDINGIDPDVMNWVDFNCEVVDAAENLQLVERRETRYLAGGCQSIQLAIETDWEFTGDLFGGSTFASSEYAATLIGAVSTIFQSDANIGMQISFLRLWETASDPWNGSSTSTQLVQFRQHWLSKMSSVSRHLVHFLSGRGLGGGIAYVGTVCGNFGYALSANLNGSFPLPNTDHHPNNWDIVVVTHELGHNCGTGHTHNYQPPIDGCGNGDCTDAFGGTIMSYCHTCSGGMSNIVLNFHPLVQITIAIYIGNLSCSLACDPTIPGGCCLEDECSEMPEADCLLAAGVFLGTGTMCSFGGCDLLLPGACCTDGAGTCVEIDAVTCINSNGTFLGIGTTCASGWCDPNAAFACCIGDQCSDLSLVDCVIANGHWGGAGSFCAGGDCDPPDNDSCETARVTTTGVWDFSTVSALTDDDPYDSEQCNVEFLGGMYSDVWFSFTACETGLLLVSTCNLVNFDSDIVVYEGTCSEKIQIECNGDSTFCAGFTSEVNVPVVEGESYLIRIGGFSDQSTGNGQLVLGGMNCQPDIPCIADVNGDGFIDVLDLLALIENWGVTNPQFDIDESGQVDLGDLLMVITAWGTCEG
jgi:hypothetical protein